MYTCDFETTTDIDDVRVWAFACCNMETNDITYGKSIEEFIAWCEYVSPDIGYFHNLGFDGYFIMNYLLKNGYEFVESISKSKAKTFNACISDMNKVYSISIKFSARKIITFYDSLKIIPLSIEKIGLAFGMDIKKGDLDYDEYREVGHELTKEEKDYIDNDVLIAANGMRNFINDGLTKMTIGANALYDYKKLFKNEKKFRATFPILDNVKDAFIREAYRGGFTYVNPKYQGKIIDDGIVFDVNSLYPSVMSSCSNEMLPFGKPIWYEGEYVEDDNYPLWIGCISCWFKVKENHIPCIQLKGNRKFKATEYIEDSMGEVTFIITNVDYELIKEQYDLKCVKFYGGYKFLASNWLFKNYVDKWMAIKKESKINGNSGMYQVSKLMLNSLYGKFGTRTKIISREPRLDDMGILRYYDLPEKERKPIYLPVAVFITSWARYKTIKSAQSVYDRFIYADTDSLHLIGKEIPQQLEVDNVELGKWKHESSFYKAKFLRAKCYIEYEDGKTTPTVHIAGLPERCHSQVNIDNFKIGAVYHGKLYQLKTDEGIVLVEGDMVIQDTIGEVFK